MRFCCALCSTGPEPIYTHFTEFCYKLKPDLAQNWIEPHKRPHWMKRAHIAKNIEDGTLKLKDLEDENGKIDATLCRGEQCWAQRSTRATLFRSAWFQVS